MQIAGQSELTDRVRARLEEQENGVDNFKKMYKEVTYNQLPWLDHASYSKHVVVRESEEYGGRGIFVTQDVRAGDLLLCEKGAFAFTEEEAFDTQLLIL